MMKRIILILVAAFLTGGMVMAQHGRRGDKMPDPKTRAERMTERMVKEYSLNDTQKKQLLEANLALVEQTGNMPMHRRPDMKKGEQKCDSCNCTKTDKHHAKADKHHKKGDKHHKKDGKFDKKDGKRAQLTDEQRAQRKADMQQKREEMQAARTAYDAQLQKIMTKDQYDAYTKKMQERKDKMGSKRKNS